MKRLLARYLLKEIAAPLAVCTVALYGLLFTMNFLRASDVLLGSAVTLGQMARLILYLTPHFLMMALPIAFLLAVLLGLGRLNEDRELVALQALGVSPWQLAVVPIAMGAALGAGMLALTFTAEPWGLSAIEPEVNEILKKNILGDVKAGTFYQELPDFTLYVADPDVDAQLWRGVLIHDHRDPASPLLVLAREGRIDPSGYTSALKLELSDGELHLSDANSSDYTLLGFERGEIVMGIADVAYRKNNIGSGRDRLTPTELLQAGDAAVARGEDRLPYVVGFQSRMAQPLAPLAFALVGGPLALSASRRGRGRGYFLTIAAYVAYYICSKLFENVGLHGQLPPLLAGQVTNVLFAALGVFALTRVRLLA